VLQGELVGDEVQDEAGSLTWFWLLILRAFFQGARYRKYSGRGAPTSERGAKFLLGGVLAYLAEAAGYF